MIIFKIILFSIALIISSAMLINKYKKEHAHEWFQDLTDIDDLQVVEDNSEWDEGKQIAPIMDIESDDNE